MTINDTQTHDRKQTEFEKLIDRVNRNSLAVITMPDSGFKRRHNINGSIVEYHINGIKSPDQLEGELLDLCEKIYSMKEHLKFLCKKKNIAPNLIEKIVDSNESLAIVIDIGNRAKHVTLTKPPRSGKNPRLVNVGIRIPVKDTNFKMTLMPYLTVIDIGSPEKAIIRASIEFDSFEPTLNALTVIEEAITAWEEQAFPLVGISNDYALSKFND